MDSYPLWSDNPSDVDLLGFEDVATPVVDAVTRDKLDPVAVALIGPWGSGKSTILDLIKGRLADDKSVLVVPTRPWEYDPNLDVKATLIGEVLDVIRERAKADPDRAAQPGELAKKLLRRVRWSKAISVLGRSALTVSLPKFEDVAEIFTSEGDTDEPDDPTLNGFRAEFEEFIAAAENISRVVVLIDDLDRCLPDAVVASLEAIKLFLSVPKMAFVIAADEGPVIEAIALRYEKAPNAREMAQQYLEKIAQIPVRVPILGLPGIEAYLALMLLDRHLSDEDHLKVVAWVAAQRKAGRSPYLQGQPINLEAEAESDVALAPILAPVLANWVAGNPRRIKRFLNAFWIRSSIAATREIQLEPAALAKLMILEEFERDQFAKIVQHAAEGQLADRLARLESEEGPLEEANAKLVAWAQSPPMLAELELRPYLELAASLSQMTFAGSGLSPEIQDLLNHPESGFHSPDRYHCAGDPAFLRAEHLTGQSGSPWRVHWACPP